MRHLNKIINFLERAGKGLSDEQDVLKCLHPGTPNITAGDISSAREELIALMSATTGVTVTAVDGKASGIFVHPEMIHITGDNGIGVLGDRVLRELAHVSVPLLTETTGKN